MKIAITSDIHLGDESSKLHPPDTNNNSSQQNSKSLSYNKWISQFIETLYNHFPRGPVDYLILNGDILDFSISSFENTMKVAQKFFQTIKRNKLKNEENKNEQEVVKQIIYIPGNHDKHIWDAVEWEVNIIRRLKKHSTPYSFKRTQPGIINLSDEDKNLFLPGIHFADEINKRYGDLFLEGLFEDKHNIILINIVYPNLYITTDKKLYIITHGHLLDAPWVLLSELLEGFEGIYCSEVKHFEEYNYPLTSMICTGVGQGGEVSKLLYKIVEEIRKNEDKHKLLNEMIDHVLSRIPEVTGKNSCIFSIINKPLIYLLKKIIFHFLKGGKFEHPRNNEKYLDIQNDLAKKNRLERFYNASLKQVGKIMRDKDIKTDGEKNISLIFGHTHVPMEGEKLSLNGIDLSLYNTGGWLKDTEKEPMIFFINEEGEVESTRLNNTISGNVHNL